MVSCFSNNFGFDYGGERVMIFYNTCGMKTAINKPKQPDTILAHPKFWHLSRQSDKLTFQATYTQPRMFPSQKDIRYF